MKDRPKSKVHAFQPSIRSDYESELVTAYRIMKVTVIAPFPRQKDGIPRVAEELLKRISEATEVDVVSVLARQGMDFLTPSLLVNQKVSLFTIARFLTPQTMVKLIRLYKESDVVLFLAPPWDVLDPLEALYFFILLF